MKTETIFNTIIKNIKTFFYYLVSGKPCKKNGNDAVESCQGKKKNKQKAYWKQFKIDFMNWWKKYFWGVSILFIAIGVVLDTAYIEATIAGKEVNITLINGETQKQMLYTYQPTNQIPKTISGILYSAAISILLLFLIENRINSQETERNRDEMEKLNSKINTNVFDGVLKKFIPKELFEKFKNDIIEEDIIRKNAKWVYEVRHNDKNSFDVIQHISYQLYNLTKNTIHQKLPFVIDNPNEISESELLDINITKQNGEKDTNFNTTDKIVELNANSYCSINLTINNKYKYPAVQDTHNSAYSIIGLEIETIQPEDVSVKIITSFGGLLKSTSPTKMVTNYEKFDCILKGQGIIYIVENKKT